MKNRIAPAAVLLALAALAGCATRMEPVVLDAADPTPPRRIITQGRAQQVLVENLTRCANTFPEMNLRATPVGRITATDGTVLTVPAETALQQGLGPLSNDLYSECSRTTPRNSSEVNTADVPVVDVDADGEVVTGFVVADNYFELYVNGKLVAVDNTPYTPFNSSIVKFRVKRPYTLAFMVVDWEEHLGLGMEAFPIPRSARTANYYPGDGGLIARFSDGTVTDASWKAQTFYIAPLVDAKEVVEKGHSHDTGGIGARVHPFARKPTCEDKCFAVHYPIPPNWQSPRFNDQYWPKAWEFTDEEIGVTALPAYTRYPELFVGARWIWSYNLVLDNVVIARKVVR